MLEFELVIKNGLPFVEEIPCKIRGRCPTGTSVRFPSDSRFLNTILGLCLDETVNSISTGGAGWTYAQQCDAVDGWIHVALVVSPFSPPHGVVNVVDVSML